MIPRFLRDALDVSLLRSKTLPEYSYPVWLPALWLTLIGVAGAWANDDFLAAWPIRLGFFILVNWLEAILTALWLMLWFKVIDKKPVEGSLFPLVVLSSTPQLLVPVFAAMPDPVGSLGLMAVGIYGVVVMIRAVMGATGQKLTSVVIAVLSFIPVALLLVGGAMTLANEFGWIATDTTTSPSPPAEETDL
ncbi:hypothetical protein [Silvimonas sp.]|uniref:hypothetical protein n=1 Tax=Silvimonas sp. TaxID=2650811 RepID=UPI00284E9D6C|nr:hypothetical protein [Silvimonas sp.]MDR3428585.1 hypothetical protein [Silvimonas sp.]